MAVSKKACSKAVGRNRIKRVVRESFRARLAGSATEEALDFVVLPTAQAAEQTNRSLTESLGIHWQKLIIKTEQTGASQADKTNQGLLENG